MKETKEITCEYGTKPVAAIPIPGTECLHAIPNKCVGCKIDYIPNEPRAFAVNKSSVFICKPVDGLYLDEQLAIAVVFNYPAEVVENLIEQAYNNEVRRAIDMFSDYSEPTTITQLREIGVYPYPKQKGAESVEEALLRFKNLPHN